MGRPDASGEQGGWKLRLPPLLGNTADSLFPQASGSRGNIGRWRKQKAGKSELRKDIQQEFAGGIVVSIVDPGHDLIGIPLIGRRPFTAEPEETAERHVRPGIPHKGQSGDAVGPRGTDFGDGQGPTIGQRVHDDGLGLNDRAAGTKAMAGRVNLVDVVAAFHLQNAALENAVGDAVLMRLGTLEKADQIRGQRYFRIRETFGRDSQVRTERRRGLIAVVRQKRASENGSGSEEKPEDFPFHHEVGEYKYCTDCRAEDKGAELQAKDCLRLEVKVIAQHEGRTGTAQRKRPEGGQ